MERAQPLPGKGALRLFLCRIKRSALRSLPEIKSTRLTVSLPGVPRIFASRASLSACILPRQVNSRRAVRSPVDFSDRAEWLQIDDRPRGRGDGAGLPIVDLAACQARLWPFSLRRGFPQAFREPIRKRAAEFACASSRIRSHGHCAGLAPIRASSKPAGVDHCRTVAHCNGNSYAS